MRSSAFQSFLQSLARFMPIVKQRLHQFHGGVFPQYHKALSLQHSIQKTLIPDQLVLPVKQTLGQKIEWLVGVGDTVQKNQPLVQAAKDNKKGLIVPIHAPTSGTITAIEEVTLPHPSGLQAQAIILTPDHQDQALTNPLNISDKPPQDPQQLKHILLNAGIIGLGGAGFPTYAKIPAQKGHIKTLIINGAECEPFITCDDLLMQTQAHEIVQGALIVAHALGIPTVVCGIESNKPIAIQAMQQAAQNTLVTIQEIATVYPMGGEKQLIQELVGQEVPVKTHAIDSGLLVFNVATTHAIYNAVTLGEPLTRRLVTITGLDLEKPYNTYALMGTPFMALVQQAKPKQSIDYPLVMGGPMMGFQVHNNHVPVIKTTNCILANPPEPTSMSMPCIRCGECMDVCPVNLLPQQMYWHSQAHEFDKVEKLNVFDCIECGSCSYVCPSHIPLVQYYRHAKSAIKTQHAEQQATDLANQRHDFRETRIKREKQEREARLKAKKEAVRKRNAETPNVSSDTATSAKKPNAAVAAAKAAAAKRAALAKTGGDNLKNSSPPLTESKRAPLSAREKAIEVAKKQAEAKTGSKVSGTKDPRISAKEAAKKAAKAAAKRRASLKEEAPTEDVTIKKETAPQSDQISKEDKRKKAMEAAKKRAAERAQQKKNLNKDQAQKETS